MTNPDGNPHQPPPSESGTEPATGGYEAPPIEQSPPGYFPPPAYEQPGYGQPGYDQPSSSIPDYPPPPAYPPPPGYPPPPPGYGAAPGYPAAPPPYATFGSPYDVPGAYPPPPPYGGYPGAYGPPRTNQLAIWSLVASVLGFICCIGSVAGVVLGVMALNQIKQNQEGGRGLAIAGIVVGGVSLLITIVLWGAVMNS